MQGSTPNRGSRPLSSNRTDTSVISTRRLLLPRPGTRSTHLSNSSGRAHQLLGPLEVLVSSIPERKRPPYRRQRWQNDAQCEGAPPLIRAQRCGVDGDCCDREPRRCTRKMRHERSSSLDLNVPSACRDRVQGRALRAPRGGEAMERIFDANWGVHTPTLQFGCFPLPSTSVFCGIFLRLNTFPLFCFRLAMNQTACSLKLHCQQSKNVASSVEGADFVASSSLWTNLMHRRWLRFALRLPFACPVRIARGAPCAFCDTRFWSRIPAGQPQPSYAFRHVAPESLLHRLVHVFLAGR